MFHSRRTLAAKLTPPSALVLLVLVAACELDHEGGADLEEDATGGTISTGGLATAGVGATGARVATGGLLTDGGGFDATGGLATGDGGFGPTGGNATGGFATGGVGTGGESNAPNCPAMAPADGANCTPGFGAPLECSYETVICTCNGFGMGAQWNCYNSACPPNVPWGDDLFCSGLEGTTCPYGSIQCVCVSGYWNCG